MVHDVTIYEGEMMTAATTFSTTAADTTFYESAACPDALSAWSRNATLVRDLNAPIQLPFGAEMLNCYVVETRQNA